jgi:GH25 family lysozyme M1 (1,4-beta-N-acetylmuramidase)
MRFPYLGAARVKYLLSMFEHRRLMSRSPKWPAAPTADFTDTRTAGEPVDWLIETRPASKDAGSFQALR